MINTQRFYSLHSLNQFREKLHPNRVVKEYDYIEDSGKKVYVIKYYRDTKKLRRLYNFKSTI